MKAFKVTWTQKAEYTSKMFNCAVFKTLVIAALFIWCSCEAKNSHYIVQHYRLKHNIKSEWGQKFDSNTRNLASCESTTDQNTCDASDSCAWCVSSEASTGCKSLSDAKYFPISVYKCDKIPASDRITKVEYDYNFRKQGSGHCPFKIALAIVMAVFFYVAKKFEWALEEYEKKGGNKMVAFTKCMEKHIEEQREKTNTGYTMCDRDSIEQPVISYSINAQPQNMV